MAKPTKQEIILIRIKAYSFLSYHFNNINTDNPIPLKIGIDVDLKEALKDKLGESQRPQKTSRLVRNGMIHYTGTPEYLKMVTNGGCRYDLNGNPCGEISEENQKFAQLKLNKINDAIERRKKHEENEKIKKAKSEAALAVKPKVKSKPKAKPKIKPKAPLAVKPIIKVKTKVLEKKPAVKIVVKKSRKIRVPEAS